MTETETETETEELHHAIAKEFEPDNILNSDWQQAGDWHYVYGVYIPDYRHPVHWARLQELLNISVAPDRLKQWLGKKYTDDSEQRLVCYAAMGTPGEAIVACVVELLEVK